MDKRKAAFILAAVGAVAAGAFGPLASMAECYIYKFTTQPVVVDSPAITTRRFVERVRPTVSFETPVNCERAVSQPVLMDSCGANLMQRTLTAPVMMQRVVSRPVMLNDNCDSCLAPSLLDRPMVRHSFLRKSRFINRSYTGSVLMDSSRGQVVENLRTLGLPIVVDRNDLNDWDTIKIKRKKILGVRQPVIELRD